MKDIFRTKKVHITVPLALYEKLKEKRCFENIDEVIVEMLIKHYRLED